MKNKKEIKERIIEILEKTLSLWGVEENYTKDHLKQLADQTLELFEEEKAKDRQKFVEILEEIIREEIKEVNIAQIGSSDYQAGKINASKDILRNFKRLLKDEK